MSFRIEHEHDAIYMYELEDGIVEINICENNTDDARIFLNHEELERLARSINVILRGY